MTVLVTDDHEDSADLLEMVLSGHGADVRTAYSAAQSLTLLDGFSPDALLLDISMPGMDGYELLARIRDREGLAHVPAVAVTGHASERDRSKAAAAGFAVHTAKPVDGEALVHLLTHLLRPSSTKLGRPGVTDLAAVLAQGGLIEALRALNARTSFRFTGLYRYDGPMLRNVALVDRLDAQVIQGADAPIETTFCGLVGKERSSFVTSDSRLDPRVVDLPLNATVLAYCGALVRNADGTPFGSLCHFDFEPREIPVDEVAMLEAFAPTLAKTVAVDVF